MPEDRVWLDNAGRPISDQARITETFRRVDFDTLEWSETIDDPKMYTKPWDALKIAFRLQDNNTEENENICSPVNNQIIWTRLAKMPRSDHRG